MKVTNMKAEIHKFSGSGAGKVFYRRVYAENGIYFVRANGKMVDLARFLHSYGYMALVFSTDRLNVWDLSGELFNHYVSKGYDMSLCEIDPEYDFR